MQITRKAAVALFVALGLKNAAKWNGTRMSTKLSKIKNMVDDDVESDLAERGLDAELENLKAVLAANEADEEVEVVDDDAETEETGTAGEQTGDASETDSEPTAASANSKAEAAAKKVKKVKKPKPPKRDTKAFLAGQIVAQVGGLEKVSRNDIAGLYEDHHSKAIVDITWYRTLGGMRGYFGVEEKRPGRLYIAGRLLKQHGLGVTDELVAMLDQEYGRPNERESRTALTHTAQVIQGFQSVAA